MAKHDFILVIGADPREFDLANRIYDAGFDDAKVIVQHGRVEVHVEREAVNRADALRQAKRQMNGLGIAVLQVVLDPI